jgi:hypothetical protein
MGINMPLPCTISWQAGDCVKEYSKRVVRAIILLWFSGAIFGGVIVVAQLIATYAQITAYGVGVTVNLPELLCYIGAPVTGGIVSYMCKSAFENKEKIKKGGIMQSNENIQEF